MGDLDGDGDVDLSDLTQLLSAYGTMCCPSGSPPPLQSASVITTVEPYNSSGYKGSGYHGETVHFCFDLVAEMVQSADDWTASGVVLAATNGAKFRRVPGTGNPPTPGSTIPEKYATFFSVPYAVNSSNRFDSPFPSGGLAGKYSPGTGQFAYTDTSIDAGWYDTNLSSEDGPAAVFRVVLDVSGVSGAKTQSGFGSVYFSQTGSPNLPTDIRLADLTFRVFHARPDQGTTITTGSFFVLGQ
jgi:hypothetical protein